MVSSAGNGGGQLVCFRGNSHKEEEGRMSQHLLEEVILPYFLSSVSWMVLSEREGI